MVIILERPVFYLVNNNLDHSGKMFPVNSSTFSSPVYSTIGLNSITYVLLITVTVFIIVIGVLGNSLILYSSVKHGVFRMDWASTMFINSLAVIDILIVVLWYGPILTSLAADRWVLGEGVCFFGTNLRFICATIELGVITLTSVYRLWKIKRAMPGDVTQPRNVVLVLMVVVVLSVLPGVYLTALQTGLVFYPITMNCCWTYQYGVEVNSTFVKGLMKSMVIMIKFFPVLLVIIVIVANIVLFVLIFRSSKRAGGQLPRRETVISLSCVCWMFVLGYIPYTTVQHLNANRVPLPAWINIMAQYLISVNAVCNPLIFLNTNTGFRKWVKGVVSMRVVEGDTVYGNSTDKTDSRAPASKT